MGFRVKVKTDCKGKERPRVIGVFLSKENTMGRKATKLLRIASQSSKEMTDKELVKSISYMKKQLNAKMSKFSKSELSQVEVYNTLKKNLKKSRLNLNTDARNLVGRARKQKMFDALKSTLTHSYQGQIYINQTTNRSGWLLQQKHIGESLGIEGYENLDAKTKKAFWDEIDKMREDKTEGALVHGAEGSEGVLSELWVKFNSDEYYLKLKGLGKTTDEYTMQDYIKAVIDEFTGKVVKDEQSELEQRLAGVAKKYGVDLGFN